MRKMKKLTTLLAVLLFATLQCAFAQSTIFGSVVDAKTGSGIPGASVIVKGTIIGGTTNSSGNFAIMNVPNDATLQISFVGDKTVEIEVENQTRFSVKLEPDVQLLGEVTVTADRNQGETVTTAMGIERNPLTLPYAVSVISGDAIRSSGEIFFPRALVGRVPNYLIMGEIPIPYSMRRGFPCPYLIVLDGVPINRDTVEDFIMGLNPEIIESVTVLRGSSTATILYGSGTGCGVIVITLKKR